MRMGVFENLKWALTFENVAFALIILDFFFPSLGTASNETKLLVILFFIILGTNTRVRRMEARLRTDEWGSAG